MKRVLALQVDAVKCTVAGARCVTAIPNYMVSIRSTSVQQRPLKLYENAGSDTKRRAAKGRVQAGVAVDSAYALNC